jgi:hypothetical protein
MEERTQRAYTERTIVAVALAKFALSQGFKAGTGLDDNIEWDDDWRVVLYVNTPAGQMSWHIAPDDQHMLEGLPAYDGKWDGKFSGRDPEFVEGWVV